MQPEAPVRAGPGAVRIGSGRDARQGLFGAFVARHGDGRADPDPQGFQTAWQHSHPTLLVANVPTALFVAAGLGWLTMGAATTLSQVFCVVILVVLGARVGWVIGHSWWLPIGGALFAGSVGCALAVLKYAIH
jgi:hypothetical protein